MKTKMQIDLAGILKRKYPHGFHVPAGIDIDLFLEFADDDWDHDLDIDIHEVLAESKAIALIWDADMLLSTYPHLTEDQAWEVLQQCERDYTAECGLTWDDVAEVVCERFPEPERWQGRIDVTITDTLGYSQGEIINRFRDMADLLAKDMPDVKANADEGSVQAIHPGETASE